MSDSYCDGMALRNSFLLWVLCDNLFGLDSISDEQLLHILIYFREDRCPFS